MKRILISAFIYLISNLALGVTSFSLPWMNDSSSGTVYRSADRPSSIFLLEGWFNGCPYCHENAPNVDRMAEYFANEDRVQVLDIGRDSGDSSYSSWVQKHQPNHPVLKDARQELIRQLGISGYPSAFIVDPEGTIRYRTTGVWSYSTQQEMKNLISQLLEEFEDEVQINPIFEPGPTHFQYCAF